MQSPSPADPPAQPAENPLPALDFSRVAPPRNLEEIRLEEATIDGICGVY